DTFPPSVVLEPDGRRGSMTSVRWEVKDENLDLASLVLEYQVEGVGTWRRVPIRRPKLIGSQAWDAGTAEALKVRLSIADRAGNVRDAVIDSPEGTASPLELAPGDTDAVPASPPPIERVPYESSPQVTAGPGFTPVSEDPTPRRRPQPARSARPRSRAGDVAA